MGILERYDEFVDGTINMISLAVVVVCKVNNPISINGDKH